MSDLLNLSDELNLFQAEDCQCRMFFFNEVYNLDFREANICFSRDFYIISDPPYNQDYRYGTYKDKLAYNEYLQLLKSAFGDMRSVIIHYPEQTVNLLPDATGSLCSESVAWVYNSNTGKQSRLITWWNCRPDFRKVGQPYKNPNDKRIKERIALGKQARLYDWWEVDQVKNVAKAKTGNPHPCPIPELIAQRIILTTTKPGDIIIDPFAGSGTILKVAKELGRRYVGFEIDPEYFGYMKSIGL
jgi:adenine-specific DNA-methyltransferase